MSETVDPREWPILRAALVLVLVIALADLAAWELHRRVHPALSRLESTVNCLRGQKRIEPTVPAGDPLSRAAGAGSLRATVEGNDVTVVLAASTDEAARIAAGYRAVGGDLTGRLERRDRTVYLWERRSSPTQRQAVYDCQY